MNRLAKDDGSPTCEYIQNMTDFSKKLNVLPNQMSELKASFDSWLDDIVDLNKEDKKIKESNRKYTHYQVKVSRLVMEKEKMEEQKKFTEKKKKQLSRVILCF